MIPEIQDILKLLGERAIMWNKNLFKNTQKNKISPSSDDDSTYKDTLKSRENSQTRQKLSHEILGLSAVSMAISLFFFAFLNATANSIVQNYCEVKEIIFTEAVQWTIDSWIQNLSFTAAVFLFVVLFLFFIGQKITYLKEIINGIEALRMHRMDYDIPLEGNNEFTELAERINSLSKTERELQQKERQMQEEKEAFIRTLSHDIRTPLTSILSYSEYLSGKTQIERYEMDNYIALMQQKAEQIKMLTNQLLDGGNRTLELIEDGKFLMEQLADEWEACLEDMFLCNIHFEECPAFSGEFDIQELRRIFDNLASNIEKYADPTKPIYLRFFEKEGYLAIEQTNTRKIPVSNVESNKIGLESIRKIAQLYGGDVDIILTEQNFSITITVLLLNKYL